MPLPEQASFNVFREQIVAALGKSALENGDKLRREDGHLGQSLFYFHNDDREAILAIDDVGKLLGRGACARVVKGCLFYPSGEKKEVAVKVAASSRLLKEEVRLDLPDDIAREKRIEVA